MYKHSALWPGATRWPGHTLHSFAGILDRVERRIGTLEGDSETDEINLSLYI